MNQQLERLPLICAMVLLTACTAQPQTHPNRHATTDPNPRTARVIPEDISSNLAPLLTADSPREFRQLAAERGYTVRPKGVLVRVRTQGLTADDRALFNMEGVSINYFSARYERVSAVVHGTDALRALAALPVVDFIAPVYGSADRVMPPAYKLRSLQRDEHQS